MYVISNVDAVVVGIWTCFLTLVLTLCCHSALTFTEEHFQYNNTNYRGRVKSVTAGVCVEQALKMRNVKGSAGNSKPLKRAVKTVV